MHLTAIHTAPRSIGAVQHRQRSDQQSQDQSHRDQAEDAAILELEGRADGDSNEESPFLQLAYGPAARVRPIRRTVRIREETENPLHVLSVYGRPRKVELSGAKFDAYS